jgi:copper resistance protein C
MKRSRRMLLRLVLAGGAAAVSSALWAHAMLERAAPAVGSTVHVAPARVELWFSEQLEPAFSTVKVLDKDGRQVDRGDKTIDRADRKHVLVSLPPLAPGHYRVVWRALSVDSHVTQGDYGFDVSP